MSPARICASSRAKSSTVDFFGDFFGEAVLGCGIDLPMRHLILSASGVGSTTIDVVLGKYMVETTTHKPVDRAVSFGGKHFEVAPDAFRKIDRDHFLAGRGTAAAWSSEQAERNAYAKQQTADRPALTDRHRKRARPRYPFPVIL
jgi:hypothetical protein